MKYGALNVLACPETGHPLELGEVLAEEWEEIRAGMLVDREHNRVWPIQDFLPRFVETSRYATSFGVQWNRYRQTQIDRFNGTTISRDRFYTGTRWSPEKLKGQRILEVGCGAGRFTQVMLDARAEVYAVDLSAAVDSCWSNNGPHPNLCVVQADLYACPFRRESFDRVFCYGVLQHTPDVKRAFMSLLQFLKPGGYVAIDVYARLTGIRALKHWGTKYYWRSLTKRLPAGLLARVIEWYVPRWLPIDNFLRQMPKPIRFLHAIVPCWNYTGMLPLTSDQIREWAILDTFDALSAWFDSPQRISDVRSWFGDAGLREIDIRFGGNGIVASACKP